LPNTGIVWLPGFRCDMWFKLIALVLNKFVPIVSLLRHFHFDLTIESLHFRLATR